MARKCFLARYGYSARNSLLARNSFWPEWQSIRIEIICFFLARNCFLARNGFSDRNGFLARNGFLIKKAYGTRAIISPYRFEAYKPWILLCIISRSIFPYFFQFSVDLKTAPFSPFSIDLQTISSVLLPILILKMLLYYLQLKVVKRLPKIGCCFL